jgi:hypothetical protein
MNCLLMAIVKEIQFFTSCMRPIITDSTTAIILLFYSNLIISHLSSLSLNLLTREVFVILIGVVQAIFTRYFMSHGDFKGNLFTNIQIFYIRYHFYSSSHLFTKKKLIFFKLTT